MPTNDPTKRRAIYKTMRVYSGSSNRPLAQKIADILGVELSGLALEQFANGEIYARYEETVRGADVFLIQSIAGENVNDMLMEVLVAADAAKRASARSITAVITHYGYARQDRKAAPREPITARLVADLLECSGVNNIITGDIKGKTCIINDDMIDTAGTLCANVRELKALGAGDIYVCATHGIFSGKAIERLNDAPIMECVVTDAIPVEVGGKIKTITVADEFASAIAAVYNEESVSRLIGGDFAM